MSSDAFSTLEAEAAEAALMAARAKPQVPVPPPSGPPLLEIKNLQVSFDGAPPVIKGVSFALRRGECLALIGESGSGKSVTSRTLVGLTGAKARIQADAFTFAGENLLAYEERQWQGLRGGRIGFVMQDALGSLDPLRTVGAEIEEPLRLHTDLDRTERAKKVIDLLDSVGVPEPIARAEQRPHELSGGMRQRALIASAIACAPELLIADEPTTALDAAVQAQVLNLFYSLRTPHNAMIVVSHDFAVVSHLADTVAVMRHGRIVEYGPIEAVLQNPRHAYTRSLIDAVKTVHGRGYGKPARVPIPSSAPAILSVEKVAKTFTGPDRKKRSAVKGVSFELKAGETIGIVGESGCGKTTTIRIALGLEKPDSGHVRLQGRDWAELSARERRAARLRMQTVFQDPLSSFDPRYTVERVLHEAIEIAGVSDRIARDARARELLELVRLDASVLLRRPLEMSGGQRQRLAIARALAPKPDILVCDEPVSALDISIQAQILELLGDLKRRLGLACIFISHDLGVIQRISDRVIVMKDGAIVEHGDVGTIFANPQHAYTQSLLAAIPILEFTGNANNI